MGFTWINLNQDEVREGGAGESALQVGPSKADLLRATVGVRIGTKPAGTGVWPEFFLAWVRDFRDLPHEVEARFIEAPHHPFSVKETKVGRSAVVAGVSIEGVRPSGMTWQLGYRGEFRDKRSVHTGMLIFSFPF